jgi:sensor domain CHASE-containing protein
VSVQFVAGTVAAIAGGLFVLIMLRWFKSIFAVRRMLAQLEAQMERERQDRVKALLATTRKEP